MRVRSHVVLLVLSSLLPLMVFATIMAVLFQGQQRASVERGLRDTAHSLAVAVDLELAASISTLRALATSEYLDRGDLRAFYQQAQRVLRAHDAWTTITVQDLQGQQLINLLSPFGVPLPRASDLEVTRRAIDTGAPTVSGLFVGPAYEAPMIGIAVPVRRAGAIKYVLGAGLDVNALGRLVSETNLPAGWIASITDRQGLVIARTRAAGEFIGKPVPAEWTDRLRESEEGGFQGVAPDGESVYSVYSRSRVSGWTVLIGVPLAVVEAPRRTTLAAVMGGGILFLLLAFALATVFGQRLANAIVSLSGTARALARGEPPTALGTSPIAEVNEVEDEMVAAAWERVTAVAARVETEGALRDSEAQIRQLQKLEAVGRLAGGIAHDFNNLLTVIRGRAQMVLTLIGQSDRARRQLEVIDKTAQRAGSLTGQLLAFSRKQILQPKVIDLNSLVANMADLLRRLIGEHIDLIFGRDLRIGHVRADPSQLEQVIINLAVNARDAMPEGGRLTLETADVELDEAYARRHAGVRPGRYVMLAVSDTGVGMDAETLSRVFEPFFTTKPPGKGTGLGLATVYGIIKQSGGNIWVYSEQGHGTVFKIYLPRIDDTALATAAEPTPAVARGTETVLVAEDDDELRALAKEILEDHGYVVLAVGRPAHAVQIAERHDGPIHLLLTDVVMPDLSGRRLAEALSVTRPGMKVLYMSGYTDEAIVHYGVLDPGIPFLQKPFTPDDLTRRVREMLDDVVQPGLAR